MIRQTLQDKWAYDISKDVISKGEIYDVDVIKQSIDGIICTLYEERLFNGSIGSAAGTTPFSIITTQSGESFLDSLISSVTSLEPRIMVLNNGCKLVVLSNQSSIIVTILYILRRTNEINTFIKKLVF